MLNIICGILACGLCLGLGFVMGYLSREFNEVKEHYLKTGEWL